ncbi:uncharacterized protein LTR77_000583 [Saxophila tyrrhenica]|uniref:Alpha/beta hydrolase fold-3 domain-containing protein n=1 Tax=Saxophila tyrrhenica TaxID=1690608 RepID=A0AAV9PN29_9PEZI|nr:hypothetical protein LTR77_000583 [Saxophila tyrrhenica]
MTDPQEPTMHYLDPHNIALLHSLGAISNSKPFSEYSIPQQRALFREVQTPRPTNPGISVSEHAVPTSHGEVDTFMYMPESARTPVPFVYYVHGGGWIFGGAVEFEAFVFDMVSKTGTAVVFPEYTLAPEKQFPAQHGQCLEVLQYILKNGDEHGLITDRVVLAGQIIAAMSVLNKQRALDLPIIHQLMLHPYVDVTAELRSGMLRDPVWAEQQQVAYFPTLKERSSILGSPGLMSAEEAKEYMSPTTMIISDQDPFKDQNEAFAKLLQTAGVSCGVIQAFGSMHDVEVFQHARDSPTAQLVMLAVCGKLREVMRC